MTGILPIIVVGVLYALLAAVLNMAVFASLDRHVLLAGGVGIVLGGSAIAGGIVVGEPLLVASVSGFKTLTIAAAAGALVGHLSTVTTIAPASRTN